MVNNYLEADAKVKSKNVTKIINELFNSASEIAKNTQKSLEKIIKDSIQRYQESSIGQFNILETAAKATVLIPPSTLNQLRNGRKLILPSLIETSARAFISLTK